MTVTADLDVDDLKVVVTITDLPVIADPMPATPWTLYRNDGTTETVVRAAIERPLTTSEETVVTDREFPLSRPYIYVLRYVHRTLGPVAIYSAWVVPPQSDLPRVSDPVSGDGVNLTVVSWPSRSREARAASFDVRGRVSPVVLSAPMGAASSEVTLRTLTAPAWRRLERLLVEGRVVQLRASTPHLDDRYLLVTRYDQSRLTNRAEDTRRLHSLSVIEVPMPAPGTAAAGSTLADLHAAFPGTLDSIDDAFAQLYEIAAAPL